MVIASVERSLINNETSQKAEITRYFRRVERGGGTLDD